MVHGEREKKLSRIVWKKKSREPHKTHLIRWGDGATLQGDLHEGPGTRHCSTPAPPSLDTSEREKGYAVTFLLGGGAEGPRRRRCSYGFLTTEQKMAEPTSKHIEKDVLGVDKGTPVSEGFPVAAQATDETKHTVSECSAMQSNLMGANSFFSVGH